MRSAAAVSRRLPRIPLLAVAIPLALIALLAALPASGAKPQFGLTTVSPADGATVSGGVRWEVAANGGTPNRVDFDVDGTLLWTEHGAPYVFNGGSGTLDTTTLSDGWHTLTATAYGPKAQTSIRILVANASTPTLQVSTLTPSDGQTLSGHVKWEVGASGQTPTKVDFVIDGAVRWTENGAPFVFNGDSGTLDTTTLADGAHKLEAIAYASGTSKTTGVSVTVANSTSSGFSTNVTQGGTITAPFSWKFSPGEPAVRGYFWADGNLLATVDGPGPYTWTLPVGVLSGGTHLLGHSWDTSSGLRKQPPSAYTVTLSNGETAPVNATPPAVSGATTVGATLTTTAGTWTGAVPMTYGYQWRRCDSAGSNCTVITGATAPSYGVQTADLGKTLRAAVVATNSVGSATALSAATAAVQASTTTTLGSKLPARLPQSSGLGGVYYVDGTNGSDSNNGSSAAPWKTINKALATVPLSGSIIKVRSGTYYSSGTNYAINFRRLASTTDPITLEAETPGTVRIANAQPGSYTLGAWITNSRGLRMKGLSFRLGYVQSTNTAPRALLIENSDRVEVTGCTFYEDPTVAVSVRGGASDGETADDVWILGNLFRSSTSNVYAKVTGMNWSADQYYGSKGSHWIYAGQYGVNDTWDKRNGSRRLVVGNNIFTGSTAGRHVELGPQARDGFVINNTFFGNHAISVIGSSTGARYAAQGVVFFANSNVSEYQTGNNVVANNIFVDLEGHAASGSGPPETGNFVQSNLAFNLKNGMGYDGSTSLDYNPYVGSSCCLFSTAAGNRASADPLFANPTGFDYRLRTGSPAVGAADAAYSMPYDYSGKQRDATPDLGALEY